MILNNKDDNNDDAGTLTVHQEAMHEPQPQVQLPIVDAVGET